MIQRRKFIETGALGLAALAAMSRPAVGQNRGGELARYFTATTNSAAIPILLEQRAPFGWKLAVVKGTGSPPLLLEWPNLPTDADPTHFRIAVGLDERDDKVVEVFLPTSGRVIGSMELRQASQFQLYQIALNRTDIAEMRKEGLGLRMTKGADLEILAGGDSIPDALMPHLLVPGRADPMTEYFARMDSLACVQQFGWMEGCVLDGLLDLPSKPGRNYQKRASDHLALFFNNGRLLYENHLSSPSDGKLYGIEATLPFAALARLDPRHPMLDHVVGFWREKIRPSGLIQDGGHLSSEGAYTVGYALAEIARAKNSEELMLLALAQVRLRQAALFDGQVFWRTLEDDGKRENRNWARGIAWQLLGMARTLTVAKDREDIGDLILSFRKFATWAAALQRDDGLWAVFADEPALTPDTAGSAGIAAALAIGANHGWIGPEALSAARKTYVGLQAHLTPDGFLGGVSQSNKGGEGLQRGDFRSIYQMGMGLMAQLIAATHQS